MRDEIGWTEGGFAYHDGGKDDAILVFQRHKRSRSFHFSIRLEKLKGSELRRRYRDIFSGFETVKSLNEVTDRREAGRLVARFNQHPTRRGPAKRRRVGIGFHQNLRNSIGIKLRNQAAPLLDHSEDFAALHNFEPDPYRDERDGY